MRSRPIIRRLVERAPLAACIAAFALLFPGCAKSTTPEVPELTISTIDPSLVGVITNAQAGVRQDPGAAGRWGDLGRAFDAADLPAEAEVCYAEAMRLDPASPAWPYLLGLKQLQDDPGTGLKNLALAVERSTTSNVPRLRLAQALVERGRFDEAALHLERLMESDPGHAAARVELARIELARNQPAAASAVLAPALTNAYMSRPAHLLLSRARLAIGDTNGALALSRRAAAMPNPFDWPDPFLQEIQALRRDDQAFAETANSLIGQRRFAQAEQLLQRVLSQSRANSEALLLLGRLRLQERRCADAIAVFREHLQIRADSLQGWVQLGLAQYCESRWDEAVQAFTRAVELKPDFAQAHYNLGLALARAGKGSAAIESYRTAIRCQPGDASSHAALAEELLQLGRRDEALREAEVALQLNPQHAKALRVREQARR